VRPERAPHGPARDNVSPAPMLCLLKSPT
jgi:hypothetical protein